MAVAGQPPRPGRRTRVRGVGSEPALAAHRRPLRPRRRQVRPSPDGGGAARVAAAEPLCDTGTRRRTGGGPTWACTRRVGPASGRCGAASGGSSVTTATTP